MVDFRRALVVVAAGMLVGCGGSQQPLGVQGLMPQNGAHKSSTSAGDLLYLTSAYGVYIYTFPGLSKVAQFDEGVGPYAACKDAQQNVYVTGGYGIQEYAHGGTTPINTFGGSWADHEMPACSVDPTTGNFAAVAESSPEILIWQNRSSEPTSYYDQNFIPAGCAYDSNGNLFITGYAFSGSNLMELAAGASSFAPVSMKQRINGMRTIQWLGSYFVVAASPTGSRYKLYKLTISGSKATVKELPLGGKTYSGFWIESNTTLIPYSHDRADIATYLFPSGKRPTGITDVNGKYTGIQGMVVSEGSN